MKKQKEKWQSKIQNLLPTGKIQSDPEAAMRNNLLRRDGVKKSENSTEQQGPIEGFSGLVFFYFGFDF